MLPYLRHAGPGQVGVDRLGWTVGRCFAAYGLRFGVRANDVKALAAAAERVPLGWLTAESGEVDTLYSLHVAPSDLRRGARHFFTLYADAEVLVRSEELAEVLDRFEQHAELHMAFHARERLFVHAGVVGWRDRAIVIPGWSMTGKTTLVKALVEAGATYYSDEYAVFDMDGRVHPYARPLSVRGPNEVYGRPVAVESLGGAVGTGALPVGLIVATRYRAGARWRPRAMSPGRALLALMDNAVAAQGSPEHSMPILRAVVLSGVALSGARGEAEEAAQAVLRRMERVERDAEGG